MKTTSKDLLPIWDELQDIFKDFVKLSRKHLKRLRKLGFKVVYNKSNHPKIYIPRNGVTYCVTFSTTPSDRYAGRQILRQIRAIYERK